VSSELHISLQAVENSEAAVMSLSEGITSKIFQWLSLWWQRRRGATGWYFWRGL